MAGSLVVDTLNGVDIASSPVLNDTQLRSALNASGDAPIYACRAWVNFNGTGTVAIRASGNVSSITDNGVGDYTVNFTTAMPDANYVWGLYDTYIDATPANRTFISTPSAPTVSQLRVRTGYVINTSGNAILADSPYVLVSIFR